MRGQVLRLQLERKARRLTLKELSVPTGIGYSTLAKLERGLQTPYPSWEVRLCRFFGLTPKELFAAVEIGGTDDDA